MKLFKERRNEAAEEATRLDTYDKLLLLLLLQLRLSSKKFLKGRKRHSLVGDNLLRLFVDVTSAIKGKKPSKYILQELVNYPPTAGLC